MRLKIVALKDTAVQAFLPPQFVHHRNAMLRALSDALKNKSDKSPDWVRHPEDFELYEVGEFDDQSGAIVSCDGPPELVVRLKDLLSVAG